MSGAIPPFPEYAFMTWCSVKALGQFYLYLYTQGTASSGPTLVQDIATPMILLQADSSKERSKIINPKGTFFVQHCAKMKDDHKAGGKNEK
jgi:hypothetical protein